MRTHQTPDSTLLVRNPSEIKSTRDTKQTLVCWIPLSKISLRFWWISLSLRLTFARVASSCQCLWPFQMQARCFSHQKKKKKEKKRLSGGTLTVVSFQNCEPQMFLWATLFSEVKLRLVLSQSWVMASIQLDSCGKVHCFVIYKMSPVKVKSNKIICSLFTLPSGKETP